MEIKTLYIDEKLHREVKADAARRGQTIKEFTEHALRAYLRELHMKTFVDTPATYTVKESD